MRTILLATVAALAVTGARAAELNALVWCDHTDPALIEPFEKAHGVKVNLKEYEGTGTALSLVEQSRPGDWDVFVIDGIDVPRAIDAGLLAPLPEAELPMADIFPELVMAENHTRDGKTYAVTEKFGYNTISYNKAKVDAAALADVTALWTDEAFEGRIAIYDYYLPVIGLVAMGLGKETAELTADDLPAIREALIAMKRNARSVVDVVSSQTVLATGEVDVLVGGGEWVTAILAAEQPELDWMIPEQGAVRWSQSIGIFADSEKKDLALEFVKYILSPEGQARLATSSCYWAMPANAKAGAVLSDQQKAALRWDDQAEYLKRAQLYPAPDGDLDAAMQDVWTEMLQQ
ncbi:spermidine/putrescine ABC transporter substrate-binding protein [Limibaculum sp. FT325]|uniref:ABC transporter substrate-binding protein n=1 Tax=Thermohalobaculum sediminis TaxID=2939436 RepID=UPI0020C041D4|nr:spermidine/putrescine ABC transporter substrate-binding protein [Limibaculum sediminis]MCL5777389.1 spermidine/putrescine ABC transporter substrate-binding protein [Limibaculum sediminis]